MPRLPRPAPFTPARSGTAPAAEELAPLDALLLHADSDPRKRSSLIGLCLLERAPRWADFVAGVDRASRTVPRLRQRVVSPLLPVSRPHWVADSDFDLAYHVRRVRVPEPAGLTELLRLTEVAELTPLDPARPLWELTLVEGIRPAGSEQERAALLWKFSHAVGDGVGVLQIAASLFDLEPLRLAGGPEAGTAVTGARAPVSRASLLVDRLADLPGDLTTDALRVTRRAATAGLRAAADPLGAAGEVIGFARSLGRLVTPPKAEPSPALQPRGTRRRLLVHEVALDQLKAAGRAAGGSVNDAYLAGVLAAMRRYHEELGVPAGRLPMAVPVYGRPGAPTGLAAAASGPVSGNHFTAVRFAAPVAERDPGRRIREVHDLVAAGRAEPAQGAADVLARIFGRTPQVLVAEIARQQGQLDLQASNVAGFPGQVYLSGVPVEAMFSFGPAPGVAVMFLLVSYNGTCGIGMTIDETAIPDTVLFARCVRDGFEEVLRLAPGAPPPRRPARPVLPAARTVRLSSTSRQAPDPV